jgi:hypothetical protein
MKLPQMPAHNLMMQLGGLPPLTRIVSMGWGVFRTGP